MRWMHKELMISVAVGINAGRPFVPRLTKMGVSVIVVDTAHGHQARMLDAIEEVRSAIGSSPLVAGMSLRDRGLAN